MLYEVITRARRVLGNERFGSRDPCVAGTEELVGFRHGLRPVGHRGDRLRSTHAIDLRRPRRARGEQECRIDRAILAARRTNHDFLAARYFGQEYPAEIKLRSYNPVIKGHSGQIKKAVQLLIGAKRPMIYTGGGVVLANAAEHLTRLTRLLGFPITNTLMGLGGYPGTDRQFLGMPGMHGTLEANLAMQHCDVLLAIGARFDDRVIGSPENFATVPRKIIHVDIDPSSISKRVRVDVPIVGNVPDVLDEMIRLLEAEQERKDISDS